MTNSISKIKEQIAQYAKNPSESSWGRLTDGTHDTAFIALADSHTELLQCVKAFYRERQHFSEAVAKQMEGVIQRAEGE